MRRLLSMKTMLFVGLMLLSSVCHQSTARSEKVITRKENVEPSNRWAILIGVDDYSIARDLRYCGADQIALREHLIASGFPEDQVVLMTTNVRENQPNKLNIEKQLARVLGQVKENDMVVFAFSGHGVQIGETSYLCPSDAKLNDDTSMLSLNKIYAQINRARASLRLVIVDACRDLPECCTPRTVEEIKDANRSLSRSLSQEIPEGIIQFTSCSAGEQAQEHPDLGHGVFMYYFLKGLQGDADVNNDNQVSLTELYLYSGKHTEDFVKEAFSDSQHPRLKGDLNTEVMSFQLAGKN
ncbi:MAG: hypothetical protein COA78_29615 [Blastopirellula sp.]|nr:MAG: hypothetical protein COA78_29615 [Blastopirellula sp.]